MLENNANSISFKYSNHLIFVCIWLILGIIFSLVSFIPQLSQFFEWMIKIFNGIGFIVNIIIVTILFSTIFIGSYILSILITDKNGTAVFYENYFEIILGWKIIKINYIEIEKIKFYKVRFTRNKKLHKYKIILKTLDKIKLNFTSSYKEIWKNYGINDKSTLGELYNNIEFYIALKKEKEYK